MDKFNVQAIFNSVDGEVNGFHGSGELATFIRLRGCNLRCAFCDTKYAQDEDRKGMLMTLEEVMSNVFLPKVTITGGEPLLHGNLFLQLLEALLESGHWVSIETNGTQVPLMIDGKDWSDRYRYIVDYKLPSSGMMDKMNSDVFDVLRSVDVIKFVISDLYDYDTAKAILHKEIVQTYWHARKVFSPGIEDQRSFTGWPAKLAELLIGDAVQDPILARVQYSLQVHKVLWPYAIKER